MIRRKKKFTFDLSFPCMQPKVFQRLGETQATDIEVEVVSEGVPFNLTGVRFGFEMRDDEGKIVIDENQSRFTLTDATKGKFTYRVDDKVFGFHGNAYLCYFVLKISDVRITTERFIITNDEDVQKGTTGLREHYVSVIDDLVASNKAAMEEAKKIQDMIEKNQVVKKTGDTMSGNLRFDKTPASGTGWRNISWDLDGSEAMRMGMNGSNNFLIWDNVNNVIPIEYRPKDKELRLGTGVGAKITVSGDINLVRKSGDTMTGNLTVPRLYAGSTEERQVNVGTGSNDAYISNTLSKKYLQLKDDGSLQYNNVPVALSDSAQMQKITLDTGGATISVSDTSKNILDEIKSKGPGMNTIYCSSGVQGQTPNNKSWRGISFLNSSSYGLVMAKDFHGKFFTNYMDNNNWLGWVEHADSNVTQNNKITQDNGDALIQAKTAEDDVLQMAIDAGRGFHTIYASGVAKNVPSSAGLRGFVNLHGAKYGYMIVTDFRNKTWTNYINGGEWQGWVNLNGDTKDGKATLILTADATAGATNAIQQATRKGDSVTVMLDITRNANSTNPVMTILPEEMRPSDTINHTVVATDGTPSRIMFRYNGEIHLADNAAKGKRFMLAFTYVAN